tara:strand:- start:47 stop:265 length:219 start_codon:yes stop_codon:yes gene_type:complete
MTKLQVKIHNASTGEEETREMNSKEIAIYEARKQESLESDRQKAEAQALRDSANEKLAALGLTPEEIAAITA